VDGRDLAGGPAAGLRQPRGIARYAASLLGAMAARHPDDEWTVLLPPGAGTPPVAGVTFRRQRVGGRAVRASSALVGRPRLDRLIGRGVDVMWLPSPAPVAVSAGVPYVLTVHDLSPELRPSDRGAYERLWSRAARPRRLARAAAAVMAVSEATRRDVVLRWGVPAERVALVRSGVWRPPAVTAEESAAVRARLGVAARYLLYVGALEPRKGLHGLLESYARARGGGLDAQLVLVGDGPLRTRLSGPGVRLIGRVDDAVLGALYAGARATLLPSWLEGFGFTPLESLAAGTPTVVSDLAPLRETLGEAGVFVTPGDVDAWASALLRIDRDEDLRRSLLAGAPGALEPLSWERAADSSHAILSRAAQRR